MNDWKKLLATLAPTIATSLGGPLAGMATKFVGDKLLGNPQATEKDLGKWLLSANPEEMARMKQIDNDFLLEMERLGVDVFKMEVEDRKSARGLFGVNIWPQITLSTVFLLGYFVLMYALIKHKLDLEPSQLTLVTALIGVLTAGVGSVMQFWFGSSSGSKQKTDLMGGKK